MLNCSSAVAFVMHTTSLPSSGAFKDDLFPSLECTFENPNCGLLTAATSPIKPAFAVPLKGGYRQGCASFWCLCLSPVGGLHIPVSKIYKKNTTTTHSPCGENKQVLTADQVFLSERAWVKRHCREVPPPPSDKLALITADVHSRTGN